MVLLVLPIDAGGRGLPIRGSALAPLQLHSYLLNRRPSNENNVSVQSGPDFFRPYSRHPEVRIFCPNGPEPASRAHMGVSPRS